MGQETETICDYLATKYCPRIQLDVVDRTMSVCTKKWTLMMLMHFTDLALANSWLLYRKDVGRQRRASCSSLSFVWKWLRPSWPSVTMLYQKTTQTVWNKGIKVQWRQCSTSQSAGGLTDIFQSRQPEECSVLQSDGLLWENLSAVCDVRGVPVQLLHSLSHIGVNTFLQKKGHSCQEKHCCVQVAFYYTMVTLLCSLEIQTEHIMSKDDA